MKVILTKVESFVNFIPLRSRHFHHILSYRIPGGISFRFGHGDIESGQKNIAVGEIRMIKELGETGAWG
jgi:hypothetical protein